MARVYIRRRVLMIVPGMLLVLAMMPAAAVLSPAQASGRTAAAVTTTPVSDRFDAQLVSGAHAGTTLFGWLSGVLDNTGVLTATVTTNVLTPLKAGCGAYTDFGPQCALPPQANVSGKIVGSTASLTAKGKGWTWTLAGAPAGKAGWAGSITQGGASLGSFTLTPQLTTVHIDAAVKSDAKSTDNVVMVGAVDLSVTANGLAVGTFSLTNGAVPTLVQGYVNAHNASAGVAIPMGKKGTLLVTAYSKPGFGNLHWIGTFVGPATGDFGTFIGQG